MRKFIIIFLLIILFSQTVYSWWSVEPVQTSTHRSITLKAITLLDRTLYPDIYRFSIPLIDATTTAENDTVAHGKDEIGDPAGDFNGGRFEKHWKEALVAYKDYNFIGSNNSNNRNAYYRIGNMAHLVADQAVPAHSANIFHAFPSWDDLEKWCGNETPNGGSIKNLGNDPTIYYYNDEFNALSIITQTQSKLTKWGEIGDVGN